MDGANKFDIPALRKRMLIHLGNKAHAYPHRIEQDFPRILAKLADLWGDPLMDVYMRDLLMTNRSDREGFPDDVASELFQLSLIHGALLQPEEKTEVQGGGWSSVDSEVNSRASRR